MKRHKLLASANGNGATPVFRKATSAAKNTLADGWSLGIALVRAPRQVGAIMPSGKGLADAMAREIPAGDGIVIELGGGTGSVTAGLLRGGIAAKRLLIVERDPRLSDRLQQRFPQCTVVCGDACNLRALLIEVGANEPIKAVVSCLPMLSMSPAEQDKLFNSTWCQDAGRGPVIQFTYGLGCPVPAPLLARFGATAKRTAWIWRNVPPASVWRLEASTPVSAS
jgi:phospholipid N-methyltransferase